MKLARGCQQPAHGKKQTNTLIYQKLIEYLNRGNPDRARKLGSYAHITFRLSYKGAFLLAYTEYPSS